MTTEQLPVIILTGFLGAGKTTLLNRILRSNDGRRIAVLVNDFGSINIDEKLVETVEGDMMSLSNGCVCCDLRGDLRYTVLKLLRRDPPPDHLIVEASGIADPVRLASTFQLPELRDRVRLDGIISVVDAEHARDPRLDAQLVRDQIERADLIAVNKADLVTADQLRAVRAWIEEIAPAARVIETVQVDLPLALIFGLERGDRNMPAARHDHHHHDFVSWSYQQAHPLDLHRTIETLKGLPAEVFRAKGILHLADAPRLRIAVQVVGRRLNTDVLGPWGDDPAQTQIVFIGARDAIDEVGLRAQLDACVAESVRAPHR